MLYKYFFTGASLMLIMLLTACSKRDVNPGNPDTIQVFNALNDGTNLYITFTDTRPPVFRTLRLLSNRVYGNANGRFNLNTSPQPFQLYSRFDTLAKDGPVLEGSLEYEKGSLYSLFVYGSKSTTKYVLHKDNIPPLGMEDSITNIRFANFSEDQVISVNLKGQPAGSFVQQIPAQGISDFTALSANRSVVKYEFEIRDFNTGDLITSWVADKVNDFTANTGINPWYNKSNTAILVGKQGGTGALLPRVIMMAHR